MLALCLFDILKGAFLYNVQINSGILFCFLSGIFIVYRRLFLYEKEYEALLAFDKLSKADIERTKFVKPIGMYVSKSNKLLSQVKLQTIMSSIEKKLDDYGVVPKYIAGTLIFLGLLGTFWGLSNTIGNVAIIIDNLGFGQADAGDSFLKLKDSLKIPLSGMGIAFGCSLFGLSSSLILGFLNINQKRTADDFLDKIEEWLARYTTSFDAIDNHQTYHGPVFTMGLLEKTIEMIYTFQGQLRDLDNNRGSLLIMQKEISQRLVQLSESILVHQEMVKALGNNQAELQETVILLSKKIGDSIWREVLQKLESIDMTISSLAQNSVINREYIVDNLGRDIRLISKTLSSFVGDE
jgi:hypothetical protein